MIKIVVKKLKKDPCLHQ
jgi:hypothetical protein